HSGLCLVSFQGRQQWRPFFFFVYLICTRYLPNHEFCALHENEESATSAVSVADIVRFPPPPSKVAIDLSNPTNPILGKIFPLCLSKTDTTHARKNALVENALSVSSTAR